MLLRKISGGKTSIGVVLRSWEVPRMLFDNAPAELTADLALSIFIYEFKSYWELCWRFMAEWDFCFLEGILERLEDYILFNYSGCFLAIEMSIFPDGSRCSR